MARLHPSVGVGRECPYPFGQFAFGYVRDGHQLQDLALGGPQGDPDLLQRLGRAVVTQVLRAVAADLRSADPATLESWNEGAREDRRRLLEADLAGGPVHELRLTVPNRPGIVAQVALALGE